MSQVTVIGISHRTAPLEVREAFALSPNQIRSLLKRLRKDRTVEEAALVSTCNRTELYVVAGEDVDPNEEFIRRVGQAAVRELSSDPSLLYRHDGTDAVRHLLRVAAALDSQIVGEHEILGQVKQAYGLAVECRTTRLLLNRLFHWAFRTGKRVRTETDLGHGSASVAQAAVQLAGRIFDHFAGRTVLLVGAGETAETAAAALGRAGVRRLVVANRTLYRAQDLARRLGEKLAEESEEANTLDTDAADLDALPSLMKTADLVLTSTASSEPVLTNDAVGSVLGRRREPVVIVDIAVPRDVEPALADLEGVFLYNMDDLGRIVEHNLEQRRQEIPRAEAIVESEVEAFERWLAGRGVVPTIKLLQRRFAGIRADEIEQHGREFDGTDRQQLDRFTNHLCGRLLHGPMTFLREEAARASLSERLEMVEAVRRMFELDDLDTPAENEA